MNKPKKVIPVEQFKKEQQYERSVPRCGSCKHFGKAFIKLVNSRPKAHIPDRCKLGVFATPHHALCNAWVGHDGSTLDKEG